MTYHPIASNICHGIAKDALSGLSPAERATVVTLLARASERSYRRGVQQGVELARKRPADLRRDLHDWRYMPSTDVSPWADAPRLEPAVHRLLMENPQLRHMGLAPSADPDSITDDPTYPGA